eukprot:CAMPEP_0177436268 /NCGR_PEP_ID=MMETSP0369-20130122/1553_1 /TAXON_ID=447022 ORGANISM="Scrippsiella hangoei-like, Strain SHHI-4" /NCGR_SAMPLE_ID=MMETSP0369 /ASSEMBLY_ACC=CAM_ASM_000364 /LENGTH=144 /DNA_ID=CAMNT_0018907601 /DNA_START=526 /DNA_END=956 /DNA_ORIENTATION=-
MTMWYMGESVNRKPRICKLLQFSNFNKQYPRTRGCEFRTDQKVLPGASIPPPSPRRVTFELFTKFSNDHFDLANSGLLPLLAEHPDSPIGTRAFGPRLVSRIPNRERGPQQDALEDDGYMLKLNSNDTRHYQEAVPLWADDDSP